MHPFVQSQQGETVHASSSINLPSPLHSIAASQEARSPMQEMTLDQAPANAPKIGLASLDTLRCQQAVHIFL